MAARGIFRGANFNLFLATIICALLLFAPLGYAANFGKNIYAWMNGTWVTLEQADVMGGATKYETIWFFSYLPMLVYAAFTVLLTAFMLRITGYNRDDRRKIRMCWLAIAAMVVQTVLAYFIVSRLTSFVGEGQPVDIEDHIQAQFFLHLFPPILTLMAITNMRRKMKPKPKPSVKPE